MEKKKQKKNYSAPNSMIVQVNGTTYLMDTSFPSQHNPAQSGGSMGEAKQAPSWLSEEEGDEESPSWED